MAYSTPTVTTTHPGPGRRGEIKIVITGTALGASDEAEITGLPRRMTLHRVRNVHTSGSAASRTPVLGRATNPSGMDVQYQGTSTAVATPIDEKPNPGLKIEASSAGSLFWRDVVNSGSNNALTTELYLTEGW